MLVEEKEEKRKRHKNHNALTMPKLMKIPRSSVPTHSMTQENQQNLPLNGARKAIRTLLHL